MKQDKIKRMKRVALCAALFVFAGIIYGIIVSVIGFGIPCYFHILTGLKCPGCGMTHACVALLHFDFRTAIKENAMLVPIAGYISAVAIRYAVLYIRNGKARLGIGNDVADMIFLAAVVLWWILRNIIGI